MTRRGDGAIIDGILEDCRDNDVGCRWCRWRANKDTEGRKNVAKLYVWPAQGK